MRKTGKAHQGCKEARRCPKRRRKGVPRLQFKAAWMTISKKGWGLLGANALTLRLPSTNRERKSREEEGRSWKELDELL